VSGETQPPDLDEGPFAFAMTDPLSALERQDREHSAALDAADAGMDLRGLVADLRRGAQRAQKLLESESEHHMRERAQLRAAIVAERARFSALLLEVSKLSCGPSDKPSLRSEEVIERIGHLLDEPNLSRHALAHAMAQLCTALADEIQTLHQLVKAGLACTCPGLLGAPVPR
jgi:hypothetical protein